MSLQAVFDRSEGAVRPLGGEGRDRLRALADGEAANTRSPVSSARRAAMSPGCRERTARAPSAPCPAHAERTARRVGRRYVSALDTVFLRGADRAAGVGGIPARPRSWRRPCWLTLRPPRTRQAQPETVTRPAAS
ncbi:hypothetical protein [Streptomyces puniciscabiei]|uniref:hypothetical protein n=1 Tax=Streptomyces puniciscabiei TaxID=164348 RepID=UPI00142EFFC6|nr:hypothetical protein [Streptomyces puniciscabiei]